MRNLLFVLVFVSIIVLGCGESEKRTKGPLENCADEELGFTDENFHKKSYKEKMQDTFYSESHRWCEYDRVDAPKTFDAKYQ